MPYRAIILGIALVIIGGFFLSVPMLFWGGILMIIVGFILIGMGLLCCANAFNSYASRG